MILQKDGGQVGKTISHYKIIEKLGEGGMGVVYKAEDMKLKRTVALKFLPPELTLDEKSKKRFVQEAQAAAVLNHPNISTVYEIDEFEDETFIAMEYIEGQTLKEYIDSGPLKIGEAIDIAIQIAEGLQVAHEKGIVHRDIKSNNIMVTEKGQAKIMDFGLAKMARGTLVTKEGTTLGTVAYMSPEQARGEAVDHRTDIWSFGVVLYEMLTGQRPFQGEYETALVYLILNVNPKPPRDLREHIPQEIERIILKALEKDREIRYGSINDVYKDLSKYQSRFVTPEIGLVKQKKILRKIKTKKILIPAFSIILILFFMLGWFINHWARVRWAREEVVPELSRLVEEGNLSDAYEIAVQTEKYIADNPIFNNLIQRLYGFFSFTTEPEGADVFIKEYGKLDKDWIYFGKTPFDSARFHQGYIRFKIEKKRFNTTEGAISSLLESARKVHRKLVSLDSDKQNMILVPKGTYSIRTLQLDRFKSVQLEEFFIDKFEVTNKEYKRFITARGYEDEKYWKHAFIKNGRKLSFEETMKMFVDQTKRPGPATWFAGDYPEGKDDYPVTGVSWYEAAAYAEYAGKILPSASHWEAAAGHDLLPTSEIALMSNFNGTESEQVGSNPGISVFGAYDMAGNVCEWCWNATEMGRVIRGGSWNSPDYMYTRISNLSPFDRSEYDGFRCMQYPDTALLSEDLFRPIESEKYRNYYKEKPCSDEIFQVFKKRFEYDNAPLNSQIIWKDENVPEWTVEKISFNAAYGNERVIVYLFLPKNVDPPYQTIIYFPGASAIRGRSIEVSPQVLATSLTHNIGFLMKNRYAFLFPIYKGTYERNTDNRDYSRGEPTFKYTEWIVQVVQDCRRSIDYLETREDININKLAYVGFSWGARLGFIITAVEKRFRVSILIVGGMNKSPLVKPQDIVDEINYVTRVKIPTLMLNGKYDYAFPLSISVEPTFNLLGTPDEQKRLLKYNSDHNIPRKELVMESLNWLNEYLGVVR